MKYDLAVIGSGAAGLSAAMNASSEKLKTVVVEKQQRLGGQAGSSSLIENFLGFPNGISGAELISRAVQQTYKFGAEFRCPYYVNNLIKEKDCWTLINDDEEEIQTKVVLLATGVEYIYLQALNLARFIGCGVSYGSPSLSENFSQMNICVVGGANSAGQAAAYLAKSTGCNVKLLIRGESIEDKMSYYLIEKISKCPNVEVLTNTSVIETHGSLELERIVINCNGIKQELSCNRLFVLIGAKPKTAWLKQWVKLDKNGFILTGENLDGENLLPTQACDGIFAAGDIVSDSVKRVAGAVGNGAMAINFIHRYLSKFK